MSSPDRRLTSPDDVRARAIASVTATPAALVRLTDAGGLALSEPVVAGFDLPRFTNAALDGYAVRSVDTNTTSARLRIVAHAFAGRPVDRVIGSGEAAVIATGAPLPKGADAVVPVEITEVEGEVVILDRPVEPGANVRLAGEDLRAGTTVLPAGTVMGPGQVAAAAALGFGAVSVHRRPRVAVVPTGDEVRAPGTELAEGQVFDAVTAPLVMLVNETGAVACPASVASDDPVRLVEEVRQACAGADAVITVGGVSMGRRDFVRGLTSHAGGAVTVETFDVALRPARPFVLGRAFGVPLFGVPGNPGAALAAFEELVRPAILAMLGRTPGTRPGMRAVLGAPIQLRPGRRHLVRVVVRREGDRLECVPAGDQGAGMIHSLARANAWAVVAGDVEELPAGSEVEVRLLTDLE